MNTRFWQSVRQKVKEEFAVWRIGAMPGILVISSVVLARVTGNLQFLELAALDHFLRVRPTEAPDEKILIVGIDENDINKVLRTYPISDRQLAELIEKIEADNPAVIGLDIVRDLPVPPEDADGYARLVRVFRENQNLIGVDKALPDRSGHLIKPPPALPPERVGFADAVLDRDNSLRRSLLSTSDNRGEYRESLTLKLAQVYLSKKGFTPENVPGDEWAIAFNNKNLPRLQSNSGGYVGVNNGGNQILLSPRSNRNPFKIVSLQDIKNDKVPSDWIRDRIVLIGVTSLSAKDIINAPGIDRRVVYGVEVQAHAVSQIISFILDDRPLIKTWADGWEYVWIIFWGLTGISLGRFLRSPWLIFLGLGTTGIVLIGICYGALLLGWWLPVVPSLLVLSINAAGLTASLFYRYQQELEYLKLRSQDRQKSIERIFDAIHAQPLQTLSKLSSNIKQFDLILPEDKEILVSQSEQLNRELRELRDSISREMISSENIIFINEVKIDLQNSVKDILYQSYDAVMRRDLPCFATLKVRIPSFKDIDDCRLSIEQKGDLCRFIEETLNNVGKYAQGVTRLKVSCGQEQVQNFIRVEDNGVGINLSLTTDKTRRSGGWGTQQAENLARQLGGKFRRYPHPSKGTICELTWPVTRSWFWFL